MKNIFNTTDVAEIKARIERLTPESQPVWGKMRVDQVLAHLSIAYEMTFEPERFPKPKGLMKYMLRWFVKPHIIGTKPYKPNLRTAPQFIIADHRNFENEKQKLIAFIDKVLALGSNHFDGLESHSFGKLTAQGWNNMFYKHLDHHLRQFGV